jgi:endogenous inhibitor of DNA gyrase (YacG/DUF329 family)
MSERTTISCTRCSAVAQVPDDGAFRPLWDAGWRWLGSLELFSCPPCPAVVEVDAEGRHRRGPGMATQQPEN